MWEIIIYLLILIPTVLVSYKVGRKKKKTETNVMIYLLLFSLAISILLFFIMKFEYKNITLFRGKQDLQDIMTFD